MLAPFPWGEGGCSKELTVRSGHAGTVGRDTCSGENSQIGNEESHDNQIADKEDNKVLSIRGLVQTVEEEGLEAGVSHDDC